MLSDVRILAGTLKQAESNQVKFDKPGTYRYSCKEHPWAVGELTVTAVAGVPAELHVWEAMPHGGFAMFGEPTPEDRELREAFVNFIDRQLA